MASGLGLSQRDWVCPSGIGSVPAGLGLSQIVYLLADIADEQRDGALAVQDEARATKWAHDGRVLGRAAMTLFE
jgi:hypothetical protein